MKESIEPSYLVILIENPPVLSQQENYPNINSLISKGNINIGLLRANTQYMPSFLGLQDDKRTEKPVFTSKLYENFYPNTLNGDYKILYGPMPMEIKSNSTDFKSLCESYKIAYTPLAPTSNLKEAFTSFKVNKLCLNILHINCKAWSSPLFKEVNDIIPLAESLNYCVFIGMYPLKVSKEVYTPSNPPHLSFITPTQSYQYMKTSKIIDVIEGECMAIMESTKDSCRKDNYDTLGEVMQLNKKCINGAILLENYMKTISYRLHYTGKYGC